MFNTWYSPACIECNYPLVKARGDTYCPNCEVKLNWVEIEKRIDKKRTMGRRKKGDK